MTVSTSPAAGASTSQTPAEPEGRFNRLASKFKFNSHFEMERFRVIVAVLTVLGILVITLTAVSAYRTNRANISDAATYTTSFTTSRTQQTGRVEGVYANTDTTRAVLLFSMADAQMSTDPNDYEMSIMGLDRSGNPDDVATAMSANLVTFGDTSQMAVVMDAPSGFDMQVLNITMTAKKELVAPNPMSEESLAERGYMGENFTTRDMWRMVFNPAASGAVVLPELDEQDFNPRAFLSNTIFRGQEQAVRKKLDELLIEMRTQQQRIGTYYDTLQDTTVSVDGSPNVSLVIPMPPAEIAGDKVEGMSSADLTVAINESFENGEDVPELAAKSDEAREVDTYDDGYMPTTYHLETNTAVAGGLDYDWRDRTIDEGYLSEVVPAGRKPKDYIAELINKSREATPPVFPNKYMLTNGKSLNVYSLEDASLQNLNMTASNLVQSYRSFYDAKRRYQAVELVNLLKLEMDLDDTVRATAVGTNPDAVWIRR